MELPEPLRKAFSSQDTQCGLFCCVGFFCIVIFPVISISICTNPTTANESLFEFTMEMKLKENYLMLARPKTSCECPRLISALCVLRGLQDSTSQLPFNMNLLAEGTTLSNAISFKVTLQFLTLVTWQQFKFKQSFFHVSAAFSTM